jgi:hypothetical protein
MQLPGMERLDLWLPARIQVLTRLDWFFVKLHTHGAKEANQEVLLGQAMVAFHRALAARAEQDSHFHYHYVTAREMYNLVRAAEPGWKGPVAAARDFELVCAAQRASSDMHPPAGSAAQFRLAGGSHDVETDPPALVVSPAPLTLKL